MEIGDRLDQAEGTNLILRAAKVFQSGVLFFLGGLLLNVGCSSIERANAPSSSAQNFIPTSPMATAQTEETLNNSKGPLNCPKYTVYFIDPATQFFTPPIPLEDHAEFVFCSDHPNLDEVRARLTRHNPVRGQADLGSARIKVVPQGRPEESVTFCSSGELTYKGKQYRLDRRTYEPALLAITEEGDRQRALAIETEAEDRGPASKMPESR
jgi:hypothetical protein